MKKLWKRIRATIGMGLAWAIVWAPAGVLIGMIVDPDGSMDEMWFAIGAYPGFLGGVVFATVLGIVARGRRFEELSVRRFGAWGAGAGLLVGTLPFLVGEPTSDVPVWLLGGVVAGVVTLMSAASAAGSLVLARRAQGGELTEGGAVVPELERAGGASPDLVGGRG